MFGPFMGQFLYAPEMGQPRYGAGFNAPAGSGANPDSHHISHMKRIQQLFYQRTAYFLSRNDWLPPDRADSGGSNLPGPYITKRAEPGKPVSLGCQEWKLEIIGGKW